MASRLAEVVFKNGGKYQALAQQWLGENRTSVPKEVAECLEITLELVEAIQNLETRNAAAHRHLQRALGIQPCSERRRGNSTKSLAPDEPRAAKETVRDAIARLLVVEERSGNLATWHRKCARKCQGKGKKSKEKRMKLELELDDDDDSLPPEEEAELARQDAEALARAKLGGGVDFTFAHHAEILMHGASSTLQRQDHPCGVDRDTLPKGAIIKQSFFEWRERIDFHFALTAMDIEVEKLAVQTRDGGTIITGDMREIGPPKMRVTWRFIGNLVILASQYVMPFNRFARLVSSTEKRFTAAEISRYYRFAAEHFIPIYLHLGRALAQAPVLSGDDTTTQVG